MLYRRAACIYNPVSGGGSAKRVIREVRKSLLKGADDVRLAPTEGPNHASALVRESIAAGIDLIAVHGGDGTVNEAIQGIAGSEAIVLLVLPGGTANVLVREVGLPTDPVAAASSVPLLVERKVQLGQVEFATGDRRYFLVMCGAGLDAEIAERTSPRLKNWLGLGAFWLRGAQQTMCRFPHLTVTRGRGIESDRVSSLVVISKSRMYGGGLIFTPRANLLANQFQIARFAGTNRLAYCGYLLAGACGLTARWPGIRHEECTQVYLHPYDGSTVRLQVDGEVAGKLPATVSVSRKTLTLLLPRNYGTVECLRP